MEQIQTCRVCEKYLAPHPVVVAHPKSKILIIGQAPGIKVHHSGIPWDDKSGETLRSWLGVNKEVFYDVENFAIVPMGFCYPGKGKNGDLPPRKECAPLWHNLLLNEMPKIQLVLLVGQYAQGYYLKMNRKKILTETVKNYRQYLPTFFPLPHPSPRNYSWMQKNPWFTENVLPILQHTIQAILH
jgi:uracil-DNA glycosylase family 4